MTLWSRMRSWTRTTFRRSRMESEMDAELRFHIEAYAEDLIRTGVPRAEALRRARLEFGGIERVKEEGREARGANVMETLLQDLRYGARMLRPLPFAAPQNLVNITGTYPKGAFVALREQMHSLDAAANFAAILMTAVTLLACYIPTQRAMRVDPLIALRQD